MEKGNGNFIAPVLITLPFSELNNDKQNKKQQHNNK